MDIHFTVNGYELPPFVPAVSMLLACACARHWGTVVELWRGVKRDKERAQSAMDRFRGL